MSDSPRVRNGVGLVIGVGTYAHPGVTPLEFATADAVAVADHLANPDVCGFSRDRVALLTDAAATRDKIVHHLSGWLPARARGADLVVLYFAGHGTVSRLGTREEEYLLPHDADPDNPVGRGIPMGDLTRWVEDLGAGAVIVCLDCCHAAKVLPHRGEATGPRRRDLAIAPAALQAVVGRGRYVLASCDEGQYSVEDPALGHGLFTYHLLEGMAGAGDRDGDGRVGVSELFEHVSQEVARDARRHGVEQKPWSAAVAAGGVYISTPRVRRPSDLGVLSLSGTATVADLEGQMVGAEPDRLVDLLRRLTLQRNSDP